MDEASSGKGAVPPANAGALSSSSSSGTVRRVAEENPHGPEEEPAREDKRSKYLRGETASFPLLGTVPPKLSCDDRPRRGGCEHPETFSP